jgi:lipoprotein-releasing system permease protein
MVFGAFERMVAFRYLRARRAESFVSVIAAFSLLGIMLGVGTLIVVTSVMNGFRAEFLTQILGFNGDISVLSRNAPVPLRDFDALAATLRGVPGVTKALPIVDKQIIMQSSRGWTGLAVRGLRADDLKQYPELTGHIVEGSLEAFGDDTIMLGYEVALNYGVHAGDMVTLVSPLGTPTPFGILPRKKSYRVAATFDTGFATFDSGYGFLTLAAAQGFFALSDGVTSIQVDVADPQDLQRYLGSIRTAVGERAQVQSWQDRPSAFLTAIRTEGAVMFVILTLIIVVAAFNIISSMIMLVRSKGRDIAILRTMGATRGMMLRIFFLAGASIGMAGTLLGLAIGLSFAANIEAIRNFLAGFRNAELFQAEIEFLSRLEAKIDPSEVAGIVLLSFVLSFLATLYPAWRAARLDPVEALRYE